MNIPDNIRLFLDERAKSRSNGEYASFLCEVEEQLDFLEEKNTPMVSPVEQMFFIEWHGQRFGHDVSVAADRFDLLPQHQNKTTGRFRIDFAVDFVTGIINCPTDSIYYRREEDIATNVKEPLLGVEIDGHQWHEKTKAQAQRDKERERFLVAHGWKILRFTGSEVFNNPRKCVEETIGCASDLSRAYHKDVRAWLKVAA